MSVIPIMEDATILVLTMVVAINAPVKKDMNLSAINISAKV